MAKKASPWNKNMLGEKGHERRFPPNGAIGCGDLKMARKVIAQETFECQTSTTSHGINEP